MPLIVQNLGQNRLLVVKRVRNSAEATRQVNLLGSSTHSVIYREYPVGSYVDSSDNLLDTQVNVRDARLLRVRAAFTSLSTAVRDYWPRKASNAAISNQAITATHRWIYHMCAAMYHMIVNTGNAFTDANTETNLTNLESFGVVDRSTGSSTVYVWYRVMLGNSVFRGSWSGFSIGSGAPIYVDFVNADGSPRTIDGANNIILSGVSIPSNFDPEEDGLILTP